MTVETAPDTSASAPRPVVTRFAPSPTGFLHIGGARTALFNWLFARANGGRFLLRIEDTDRARSTPEATQAILDGMRWLGLDWDGEAVSQFARADRHRAVAHAMLEQGHAYKCFATPDEIAAAREQARAEGRPVLFQSPWRDADPATHPTDRPFVIRLKAPREGTLTIRDKVQGKVSWKKETLDDLVLLRADGTPTYMLAVVVDDHDMGVTHVIRGDDHLNNAARQTLIYIANGWTVPVWAHIPLIHGPDGKKLSKRHGALGVGEYRKMGYLPEAMRNYLARLGWSHGNDEFFTTEQAVEWFALSGITKAPARFDFKKLDNLSGQHIRAATTERLLDALDDWRQAVGEPPLDAALRQQLARAMPVLKERAKKLPDILESARFLTVSRPVPIADDARELLDSVSLGILERLTPQLQNASWERGGIEQTVSDFARQSGLKLGQVAAPLRAALTGRRHSPSVFAVMELLGRDETLARIGDVTQRTTG